MSRRLSEDVRSRLRFFAFYLGNGSLCDDVLGEDALGDLDYRQALVEYGSDLEAVFAIWGNVLEIDDNGKVLNAEHAERRAAQWIRAHCDPSYTVEPPFEKWETKLH